MAGCAIGNRPVPPLEGDLPAAGGAVGRLGGSERSTRSDRTAWRGEQGHARQEMREFTQMQCTEAREQLNRLCDGERLEGARVYFDVTRHCLACAECRAVWRLLKRQRRLTRYLPSLPLSPCLREKVTASLPPTEAPPALVTMCRARRGFRPSTAAIAAAVFVAAVLVAVTPWKGGKTGAAAVEAAVQSANTWHLVGWKLRGGQRIPWEIWGRRAPFFYREQIGDEETYVIGDSGPRRISVLPREIRVVG